MKVYVDEMPKRCSDCPCFQDDIEWNCGIDDGTNYYFLDEIDGGACPLHSLTDHDQQVRVDERRKVVEEIRPQLYKHFNVNSLEEYEKLPLLNSLFTLDVVTEILDQVEKGEK